MSIEDPVAAPFAAWNAHDLKAFVRCFADNFCAYRMPSLTLTLEGKSALREFYASQRFNNPAPRAELVSRTVLGNKVFDHELICGLAPDPVENMAVFEVDNALIKTAWFYYPS